MINKVSKHLLLANSAVFLLVLTIFAAAVYFSVMHNLDGEQKRRLLTLTDAVIGSFDLPDSNDEEDTIPEILRSDKQHFLLKEASLQWFNSAGQLVTQKGSLTILAPFRENISFQIQANPHALLLTRPVQQLQRLSGYLRAGISLAEFDLYRNQLVAGLVSGIIFALIAACIGVLWLVRQALKPLENTIDKLTQFTSDASHELRNPLMVVKTNAAVALRHEDGMRDKDREKFEKILDATNQMIRTTTGLLTLAQTEQNTLQEDVVTLNLADVISQLTFDVAPLAASKSIELETQLADGVCTMVREDDMKSLLGNVLDNAIHYTNPGGKVIVKSYKQGKRAVVEVADNGIGIKRDELPKIFDRFWRSDKARSHRLGGNGLGLAIVSAIVDRYGGNIVVSSKRGEGTKVTLTLPSLEKGNGG